MFRLIFTSCLLFLTQLTLISCGQTGRLYLPESTPSNYSSTVSPTSTHTSSNSVSPAHPENTAYSATSTGSPRSINTISSSDSHQAKSSDPSLNHGSSLAPNPPATTSNNSMYIAPGQPR